MDTNAQLAIPLGTPDTTRATVGGKGQSLSRMVNEGLPVPIGFLITTNAYQAFVDTNELQPVIARWIADASCQEEGIHEAAEGIRSAFQQAVIPAEVSESIREIYDSIFQSQLPVAVRSSATAEDLPTSSFAGQQDTYLNINEFVDLLDSVRSCWASLWSARAIKYRSQLGIDQESVAMGVVVQQMIPAEVSGILFTANPVTGARDELVVNSSVGLGEAIVSGNVTPDEFVIDRQSLEIKSSRIGAKETKTVSLSDQGTGSKSVSLSQRNESSIDPNALAKLGELCLAVEYLFENVPQDIEWAIAAGKTWILQSRPITNLPPAPLNDVVWEPPHPGAKLIRRQVVENMPEPLSPLFDDLYLQHGLEKAIDQFMKDWKMRIDVGVFVERPFFLTVNGYAYSRANYRFSWRLIPALPRIVFAYLWVIPNLLRGLADRWRDEELPVYLDTIEKWNKVDVHEASSNDLLDGICELADSDAYYWFKVSIMVGAAKVTDGLLHRYLQSWLMPGKLTSGAFLIGFQSKTMEAQAALESIARKIQASPPLRQLFRSVPSNAVMVQLAQHPDGTTIIHDLENYLRDYGHQVYNLDFAAPTLAEDPVSVIRGLQALVNADSFDSLAKQASLVKERDELVHKTEKSVGPIRRWMFRRFLRWAQNCGPGREEALFYMGAAWGPLRCLAKELGERLVSDGFLRQSEDLYFLRHDEIRQAIREKEDKTKLIELVIQRRDLWEARQRLHPPGMIPDGEKWKIGPFNMTAWATQKKNEDTVGTLDGFPVSPGVIRAPATVILSPDDFQHMKPDTILVCPTTTPAWTPLFAQAAGLVTDIGGILAHGSIVAREYGIPAVLGTGNATRRIATGDVITVNGDQGTVELEKTMDEQNEVHS